MKIFFTDKIVTVRPKNGDKPYETYLLSVLITNEHLVFYVSGIEALFEEDVDVVDYHSDRLTLYGHTLSGKEFRGDYKKIRCYDGIELDVSGKEWRRIVLIRGI